MKLRFLGQTYSLPQQQIPTAISDRQACYRGQQYSLRVPAANLNSSAKEPQVSAAIYKYRGVSYVVERQLFTEKPNKPEPCYR